MLLLRFSVEESYPRCNQSLPEPLGISQTTIHIETHLGTERKIFSPKTDTQDNIISIFGHANSRREKGSAPCRGSICPLTSSISQFSAIPFFFCVVCSGGARREARLRQSRPAGGGHSVRRTLHPSLPSDGLLLRRSCIARLVAVLCAMSDVLQVAPLDLVQKGIQ